MPKQKLFELVIPAHNEERRIGQSLKDHLDFWTQKLDDDFLISVVANNCSDKTVAVVSQIAAQYPGTLRVIDIPERIGKGGALIRGFEQANARFIGFVDADSSVKSDDLYEMFQYVQARPACDGVIGSRYAGKKMGKQNAKRSVMAHVRSRVFNLLVKILFGMKFTDTQCGAKIFRAEALHAVLPLVTTTDMAFDVDLLLQLHRKKYHIDEYAINWVSDDDSTISNFGATSQTMFLSCLKLRFPPKK
jgi:dolichol-phosphate mannosyltransferase